MLLVYNLFRRIILLFSDGGTTEPDERRRDFLKKSVLAAPPVPFLVSGYGVLLGRDPARRSIASLTTPYAEGLFRLRHSARSAGAERRETTQFVGRGIGLIALPIRVNCPPQTAHLDSSKPDLEKSEIKREGRGLSLKQSTINECRRRRL